jgi:hypothetical protein
MWSITNEVEEKWRGEKCGSSEVLKTRIFAVGMGEFLLDRPQRLKTGLRYVVRSSGGGEEDN